MLIAERLTFRGSLTFWVLVGACGLVAWVGFLSWNAHPLSTLVGLTGMVLTSLSAFALCLMAANRFWLQRVSRTSGKIDFVVGLVLELFVVGAILVFIVRPMLMAIMR